MLGHGVRMKWHLGQSRLGFTCPKSLPSLTQPGLPLPACGRPFISLASVDTCCLLMLLPLCQEYCSFSSLPGSFPFSYNSGHVTIFSRCFLLIPPTCSWSTSGYTLLSSSFFPSSQHFCLMSYSESCSLLAMMSYWIHWFVLGDKWCWRIASLLLKMCLHFTVVLEMGVCTSGRAQDHLYR